MPIVSNGAQSRPFSHPFGFQAVARLTCLAPASFTHRHLLAAGLIGSSCWLAACETADGCPNSLLNLLLLPPARRLLSDGRLKLIDGHLRRDLDPDMEVDVEILDVDDAEARALLLSIDPLAALAENQSQLHERLLELTPTVSPDLRLAWENAAAGVLNPPPDRPFREVKPGPKQILILITCRDEKEQVELLRRFIAEGIECRAMMA